MPDYLFVYGTLHHSIKNEMSVFLSKNSDFIGDGFISGKLFDVGNYPALILDTNSTVFGSIYQLKNELVLSILDAYEGFDRQNPTESLYIRTQIDVKLQDKKSVNCWVYIYNKSTQNLKEIESGNYLEYLKTKLD
ncbi:MAG: gamma-glutamylcyclotransferase [Polaribacter sp.]|nr:gamma-glutamylcyclotransferase [Polaribacter sp.]